MNKFKLLVICIASSLLIYNMDTKATFAETDLDIDSVYNMLCKTCHAPDGKGSKVGKKFKVPDFTDKVWQESVSDEEMIKAMSEGTDNEHFSEGIKPLLAIAGIEDYEAYVVAFIPKIRAFAKHQD